MLASHEHRDGFQPQLCRSSYPRLDLIGFEPDQLEAILARWQKGSVDWWRPRLPHCGNRCHKYTQGQSGSTALRVFRVARGPMAHVRQMGKGWQAQVRCYGQAAIEECSRTLDKD
jgi:hypothetical protein